MGFAENGRELDLLYIGTVLRTKPNNGPPEGWRRIAEKTGWWGIVGKTIMILEALAKGGEKMTQLIGDLESIGSLLRILTDACAPLRGSIQE